MLCHILIRNPANAADDEDSYTKEETKTPKFVNLVHAASIQKQASQALQVPQAAAAGTPRAQPANGHAAPAAAAALPPTEIERSGLVTSSLPEPLNDQQVRLALRLTLLQIALVPLLCPSPSCI